jgi:pimeloyl-ACP methyl ester carboxylesterase
VTDVAPVLARADDGVDLALYRAPRDAAPTRATPVLLVHGTFSNRRFFLGAGGHGLARTLARRGYDAWVAELRGHGRSGERGRASAWHFEDWIRGDAPALVRAVLEATGAERLVWIGHSAGGVIGVAFAGLAHRLSGNVAGLVLAGAPAPTGLGAHQVPLVAAALLVTRAFGRFPARLVGMGPEDEHPGVMEQWMRWNLSGRWRGADGTDYYANLARVAVPVLAIAGGGDRVLAPPRLCRDLVEATASADRTFVTCGRAQGFAENFTHERMLVSSAARTQVWPLIGEWLERRFT